MLTVQYHTFSIGTPCDVDGNDLSANSPLLHQQCSSNDDYSPFSSRAEFELADLFYRQVQMSNANVSRLMNLLFAYNQQSPPFSHADDMLKTIDSITVGDVPWESFAVRYNGPQPEGQVPLWMNQEYDIWFHSPHQVVWNQIGNSDFATEMDYAPKWVFNEKGKQEYEDFMSGNWAWREAVSASIIYDQINSKQLISSTGQNHWRWAHAWCYTLPNYSQQRQDYSFCCNWPKWILPTLLIEWYGSQ